MLVFRETNHNTCLIVSDERISGNNKVSLRIAGVEHFYQVKQMTRGIGDASSSTYSQILNGYSALRIHGTRQNTSVLLEAMLSLLLLLLVVVLII